MIPSITEGITRAKIFVYGVVQGVGFRPFVDRFAQENHLTGWVLNSSSGVEIEVEGEKSDLELFIKGFAQAAPPLSLITHMEVSYLPPIGHTSFIIKKSIIKKNNFTLISPDVAVCRECLEELYDPHNRRYHYPFINCTNCGPRYTIIKDIPYDRQNTTMEKFTMCSACAKEYSDTNNRRFHAQPIACWDCGPKIWLEDLEKKIKVTDPIKRVNELLAQGKIIAIKGLGGFHLVCDGQNEKAVQNLREKKIREEKPFALMVKNLQDIQTFCFVSKEEEASLSSPKSPIVLLKKKNPSLIAPSVAPKSRHFGVMLPYTPLHSLIMEGHFALVMTSGNISHEPIVISNKEADQKLKGIADFFLFHNRKIYTRSDDSVVFVNQGKESLLRRSRGYCPLPIHLSFPCSEILACGAELKNTICLSREKDAFVSQYIGDLENLETFRFFEHTVKKMKRVLKVNPQIIAYDMHPDYFSTKFAKEAPGFTRRIPVQHHHAHIAGCMAENNLSGKVIGISWDGTGYGPDDCVWGGEFLIADYSSFERIAHFCYLPLPGGHMAIKEPYRMALVYLMEAFGDKVLKQKIAFFHQIDKKTIWAIQETITKRINSPLTSSAGRLFESVAAIVGLRNKNSYEGQSAIELEYLASLGQEQKKEVLYPYLIRVINKKSEQREFEQSFTYEIDVIPMIRQIVMDVQNGLPSPIMAYRFHYTMAMICLDICMKIRKSRKINTVALSGGVFQNRLLTSLLLEKFNHEHFNCFIHQRVPANDGGISLGQLVIANAKTGNTL